MSLARKQFAQECIYKALVQLMQQRPYNEINISDICKKAGVSRMAYYRNYNDKDDIIVNQLDLMFEQTFSRMKEKNIQTTRQFWYELFSDFKDAYVLYLVYRLVCLIKYGRDMKPMPVKCFRRYCTWILIHPSRR